MFEILLAIILGIIAGTITGLIPGIHINLVATFLLVYFTVLIQFFEINHLIIFILCMGTIHTFVDFIPSILFGVPSSDTALSVLPAHKLVLEGKAYEAIFLSSIGSLFGLFFVYLTSPIFYFSLEYMYNSIKNYIPYLLIFTLVSLLLLEKKIKKIVYATIIITLSGALGMLILNTNLTNDPLLLLFTGLFGISSIFLSLKDENSIYPKQIFKLKFKVDREFLKAISVGGICSSICSVSPGIGNSQAATLASLFFKEIEAKIFIVVTSAINTINFTLSIITFYLIDRARNGAIVAISNIIEKINTQEMLLYLLIVFITAIVGFIVTLLIGKTSIKIITKLNFKIINYTLLILLFSVIFFLNSFIGIIILLCSASIGVLCVLLEVRRVHLMAVLLIPVILNLI